MKHAVRSITGNKKRLKPMHKAHLISAKLVARVRQNQKTDKNDALAIIQAAQSPDIQCINGKRVEQQQLPLVLRLRELGIKQKTALSNQLKSLLLEFNVRVSTSKGGLRGTIKAVLEDAENGLSCEFREALDTAFKHYLAILGSLATYDKCLEKAVQEHADCKRLYQLEGVGIINAINLYIAARVC